MNTNKKKHYISSWCNKQKNSKDKILKAKRRLQSNIGILCYMNIVIATQLTRLSI